jgi:hypothetical protein
VQRLDFSKRLSRVVAKKMSCGVHDDLVVVGQPGGASCDLFDAAVVQAVDGVVEDDRCGDTCKPGLGEKVGDR